jgi:hypothetical protein
MNREYDNPDLKELRELGYDVIADEIAQSLQRWDDGLKCRRPTLIEDYFHGQIRTIHAHVLIRVQDHRSPSRPYCIQFESQARHCHGIDMGKRPVASAVNGNAIATLAVDRWLRPADRETAMLVGDIQFMDLPQGCIRKGSPSVVRLKRLDDTAGCGAQYIRSSSSHYRRSFAWGQKSGTQNH